MKGGLRCLQNRESEAILSGVEYRYLHGVLRDRA